VFFKFFYNKKKETLGGSKDPIKLKCFFFMSNTSPYQNPVMTELITEPSICIPRTLNNITWRQVKETFEVLLGKGTVERVDIVASKGDDAQPFCRIFVHFRYWPNNAESMAVRQRLIDGEVIKVVYDNPWFWKCSASRVPKPAWESRKVAPYIEYTGETAKKPNVSDSEMTTPPPASRSESPLHIRRAASHAARTGENQVRHLDFPSTMLFNNAVENGVTGEGGNVAAGGEASSVA
jgi:hypothetical protein